MNDLLDRELIAHVVIALAACVGAWVVFVQPRTAELHRLESAARQVSAVPHLTDHGSVERLADRVRQVREQIGDIQMQNASTRDSSRMYALIMKCATDHGVRIDHLDPEGDRRESKEQRSHETTKFQMQVEGSYDQVGAFLEAVDGIEGFIRPVALNLLPKDNEGRSLVKAQFTCETIRFAVPPVLVAMKGGGDADQ